MAKVVATGIGYYGLVLRLIGDVFEIEDEVMDDPDRRPSWASKVKGERFGGKGDHDGDGKPGGSAPAAGDATKGIPDDWRSLKAADKRALAEKIAGNPIANAKDAEAVIDGFLSTEPFGDAPAPATVQGNGIQEALGGTQPDWVDPGGAAMVED